MAARPAPLFIGEHRALDFLNTVASPWGAPIEWIGTGRDLAAWLDQAGLAPRAAMRRLVRATPPAELDRVAKEARGLREWFRGWIARRAGHRLAAGDPIDVRRLNRVLARGETYRRLEPVPPGPGDGASAGGVRWRAERRWRTAESLLEPVAEAMGDLLCRGDLGYVRRCERCALWFEDVSRGHRRRWCSMAVCGNRAKASAHRARQRG